MVITQDAKTVQLEPQLQQLGYLVGIPENRMSMLQLAQLYTFYFVTKGPSHVLTMSVLDRLEQVPSIDRVEDIRHNAWSRGYDEGYTEGLARSGERE